MRISIHNGQYDRISADVNPVKRGDVYRVNYPPEVPRLLRWQIIVAVFLLFVGSVMASVGLLIGLRDVVIFVISAFG